MLDINKLIERIERMAADEKEYAYILIRNNPTGAQASIAKYDAYRTVVALLQGEIDSDRGSVP